MKRFFVAFLLILLATGAAARAAPVGHPAIWKVQGKSSTVFLLGSVHLLSPDAAWRDARIDAVVRAADVFYFEAPPDPDAVRRIVAAKGALAPGQSLRALLPRASQRELDEDLALLGLKRARVDSLRPWLAGFVMLGIQLKQAGIGSEGVDLALIAEARASGKPLRFFETTEQQMALFALEDKKLELEVFESFLADFKGQVDDIAPMMSAWMQGDSDRMSAIVVKDYVHHPALRKMMLDSRNAAWLETLKDVLDKESGTFLVTVGTGHLATERGLPALLRRAGYAVSMY